MICNIHYQWFARAEDYYRDQFHRHLQAKQSKNLPEAVTKFISTIKHSVRTTMRNKGGTPFSIIRQMFLYWDRGRRLDFLAKLDE